MIRTCLVLFVGFLVLCLLCSLSSIFMCPADPASCGTIPLSLCRGGSCPPPAAAHCSIHISPSPTPNQCKSYRYIVLRLLWCFDDPRLTVTFGTPLQGVNFLLTISHARYHVEMLTPGQRRGEEHPFAVLGSYGPCPSLFFPCLPGWPLHHNIVNAHALLHAMPSSTQPTMLGIGCRVSLLVLLVHPGGVLRSLSSKSFGEL